MFLETERLVLKPLSSCDEEKLISLLLNPAINDFFMIPDINSTNEAHQVFLKLCTNTICPFNVGIFYSGILIGFMNGFGSLEELEIGYFLDPSYQHKGYMREALCMMVRFLYQNGAKKIISGAFLENSQSINVLINSGFEAIDKMDIIEYKRKRHKVIYYEGKKES